MERKAFIDVAKGIAMLLVVMQHTGGMLDPGIRLLCKVDVPLFFLVSGWLAWRPRIDIRRQLAKSSKRILVPFFLASLFASLYFGENPTDVFLSAGKRGYWFLEALFLMMLCFWTIYRNRRTLCLGGMFHEFIFLFLTKYGPEHMDNILCVSYLARYYPCFIIGALLRSNGVERIENVWAGVVLIVISWVGLGFSFESTNVTFLAHVAGYASAAALAFMFVRRYSEKLPVFLQKSLAYVGVYSLNVYIIHFYFVHYLSFDFPGKGVFVIDFTFVFALSVIVTCLSIATGKVLTLFSPLRNVLTA